MGSFQNLLNIESENDTHTQRLAIDLFPNPSNSTFNIHCKMDKQSVGKLEIYNTVGQKVFEQKLDPVQEIHQISKDKIGPTGIYICTFTINNERVKTEQIIITE